MLSLFLWCIFFQLKRANMCMFFIVCLYLYCHWRSNYLAQVRDWISNTNVYICIVIGDPIIWPKSGTGYPTPMFISVLSLEIQLSGPSQGLDIQHQCLYQFIYRNWGKNEPGRSWFTNKQTKFDNDIVIKFARNKIILPEFL
jgi:hypothetical protein